MSDTPYRISLKAARVNADLTQREVAKLLGKSPATYNKWEQRPELISSLTQDRIAEVLNIPAKYINFFPNK